MQTPKNAATATDVRRNNRNRVFRSVYDAECGVTKQELSRLLGLSMPTILQNVKELTDAQLLIPGETTDSTGGRKAQLLLPNNTAHFAVGVSVTSRHLRLIAIDLHLNTLAYEKVACSAEGLPQTELIAALSQFLRKVSLPHTRLLGVGIAVPGILSNAEAGDTLLAAPTLHVHSISLSPLRAQLPYPVQFLNDANAGGFAEWWNRPNSENLAYLSLDKGVGGAVLLRGSPYTGDYGRSGEFGHMCLDPAGSLCSCGRRGCFEALCSADRISEDLGITPDVFFARLHTGDVAFASLWETYLGHLARGIGNIRMALDCPIVLGGTLAQYLEPYLPSLRARLTADSPFGNAPQAPDLRLCRYRSQATCIGAALHFVSGFLETI